MARAKRTGRAEARRRHRAIARAAPDSDGLEQEARSSETTPTRTGPPKRPSIRAAFRESFRPLDLRADLDALPRLVVHRSVLVPAAFSIGSAWLFVAIGPSTLPEPGTAGTAQLPIEQIIVTFLLQYFVAAPPVGAVFLAGFLAPRAGWLTGLLAGVVAASVLAILVTSGRAGALDEATRSELVAVSFALSPSAGVVFGGAAAWYRRFLQLTNPNRNRRPPPGKASRTNARRR